MWFLCAVFLLAQAAVTIRGQIDIEQPYVHQTYLSAAVQAPVLPAAVPTASTTYHGNGRFLGNLLRALPHRLVLQQPATLAPQQQVIPIPDIPAQHTLIQQEIANPVYRTSTYEYRRPAIQKQLYGIKEQVLIKPVGSAFLQVDPHRFQLYPKPTNTQTTTTPQPDQVFMAQDTEDDTIVVNARSAAPSAKQRDDSVIPSPQINNLTENQRLYITQLLGYMPEPKNNNILQRSAHQEDNKQSTGASEQKNQQTNEQLFQYTPQPQLTQLRFGNQQDTMQQESTPMPEQGSQQIYNQEQQFFRYLPQFQTNQLVQQTNMQRLEPAAVPEQRFQFPRLPSNQAQFFGSWPQFQTNQLQDTQQYEPAPAPQHRFQVQQLSTNQGQQFLGFFSQQQNSKQFQIQRQGNRPRLQPIVVPELPNQEQGAQVGGVEQINLGLVGKTNPQSNIDIRYKPKGRNLQEEFARNVGSNVVASVQPEKSPSDTEQQATTVDITTMRVKTENEQTSTTARADNEKSERSSEAKIVSGETTAETVASPKVASVPVPGEKNSTGKIVDSHPDETVQEVQNVEAVPKSHRLVRQPALLRSMPHASVYYY